MIHNVGTASGFAWRRRKNKNLSSGRLVLMTVILISSAYYKFSAVLTSKVDGIRAGVFSPPVVTEFLRSSSQTYSYIPFQYLNADWGNFSATRFNSDFRIDFENHLQELT